ncbi:hypothetical protein PVAP13_2KG100016, partial [Panicum virgatum]
MRLSYEQVHREVMQQLRIPGYALDVVLLKSATFLLRFGQPAQRNVALGRRSLAVGGTRLHLMPWTRQFGAKATSKLKYRVRVCIEGVPAHAADIDTISKLFSAEMVIDRIDTEKKREEERACICVWITTKDPDSIAIEGTLRLEEPVEFSEEEHNEFFMRLGDADMDLPEVCPGVATLLDYDVMLHIDEVWDFTTPPSSPSWKSYGSDISGIPADSSGGEWPVKHYFSWCLGVPDRRRSLPRVPVHERLGGAVKTGRLIEALVVVGSWYHFQRTELWRSLPRTYGRDVGLAAGGLASEGGEDAVSDGAIVLEGPGQVRKEDIAASEEAGLGFLFGERSDNHAAACDPMLLEVVTQDGRVLGSAQVTGVQAVAGVLAVAHEPDMGAQVRTVHPVDSSFEFDPMRVEAYCQGLSGSTGHASHVISSQVSLEIMEDELLLGMQTMAIQTESSGQLHQSEAQTVLDHLSPQSAHSLEGNGLFIAKLPETLLATPIVTKNSNNSDSDNIPASVRRSTRIANRPKSDLTMEQLATVLLMMNVQDKLQFLAELRAIKQVVGNRWVLLGDFNLILDAADKSNDNLNRRLMSEFRNTINYLELKEINLTGRKFTWSNDTTQTRIDRAFCTVDWEMMQLSDHEVLLRHDLKVRILGLTAVEKLRLKQQSRLSAIRAAEANSKLFYLHANGRRRKNFI